MDIKNILSKIEDCKKESQKKDLLKNFKILIASQKAKKVEEQLSSLNYEKTLNKLYKNKDFDIFLEILTSIIKYIPSLSEIYRKKYQEIILNLVLSKNLFGEEMINNYYNYFLIATNNLDDINNIKHKKYLIYFLFFEILFKSDLDTKIINLFIKLEKYITKYQHELIIYILTLYSFQNKNDDFPNEISILQKIIDFCKFDLSNNNVIYLKNYEIMKNIVMLLLLYTPFKQEILIHIYNSNQNYFINMIQEIIMTCNNSLKEDNNYSNKNDTNIININNFFFEETLELNFDDINNTGNNILNNYFSNKEYFKKQYYKFIGQIKLKELNKKNKLDIYRGILWTLSSLILKIYFSYNSNQIENDNNNLAFDENKIHCLRLFIPLITIFQNLTQEEQKSFVKQYLELIRSLLKQVKVFEDWNYILDILNRCTNIIINKTKNGISENDFKNEINIINEIFIIILNMYNNNNLMFCNMENLSSIIHKYNQFLEKDSLLCFYIDIYLPNEHENKKYNIKSNFYDNIYINFINNLEILFFNIFTSAHKNFTNAKNYLLEIIRVNYLNDNIRKEEIISNNKSGFISKRIIIEKVLEKYLENVFISFGDDAQNYSFFNYILIEILSQSINIDFMNQILTLLIFNSNEKINKNLYESFGISVINNLFENLINNSSKCLLSKEKLQVLIDFFFDENNMNDENIFKIGLSLLKCFIVNNNHEIIFVSNNNKNNINNINLNDRHSMLVIDYYYNKIFNKKPTFEENEFIIFHKNFYAPYVVLPHIQLFKSINENMENDITKSHLMENILELYYICFTSNISFIKNVNLNKFFSIIFEEKELTKISSSKKVTNYLIKIMACLPYQLSNDMMFNSSQKIALNIKKNANLIHDTQLKIEPKYKISIINFLINFWSKLNLIITKTLNKIINNEQLYQTNFNNNNEKVNLNERQTKTIMYNFINKGDSYTWCGELNLYSQFDYLYNCIKLLKLYLISSMNDLTNNINSNNSNQDNAQKINRSINIKKLNFSPFKSIIQKIIKEIFSSINYKYFNKKYTYFVLSLLYDIKELLPQFISEEFISEINRQSKRSFSYSNIHEKFKRAMSISNKNIFKEGEETTGINIVYKVIFISLFLSWNKDDIITSSFDKYFKTNYKLILFLKDKLSLINKFYEERNNFEKGLEKIIQHLGDLLNLYLMEYIPENKISIMINLIDEIFPEYHSTYREYYFNKMAEWNLKIKKNRDNMNIDFKNIFDMNFLNNINNNYLEDNYIGQKVLKNSLVFYGNNSLIVMNPININKCSFTLRNPICNINLIFDTDVPIVNNNDALIKKEEKDESSENEEEEEEDDESIEKDKKHKNEDINDDSSYYFSDDSNELNNSNEGIIPPFLKTEPTKKNKINEKTNVKIFEFEETTEDIKPKEKNGENNANKNYEINNKYKRRKSKEFEDKIILKNYNIYPPRRKRFNTDFNDHLKKSMLLAEKKKMMNNCLKIFSLMTELTDYKIEQYKYFDITKNKNLYKITKIIQNLDISSLYYTHDCAFIYYSEKESSPESMASYMIFLQKLGMLYDYYDIYPDFNIENNKSKNGHIDSDKYIIINQDCFTRINFNILNLIEKNEKKLMEDNDIIFIWMDDSNVNNNYSINIEQNKLKIFFIINKINDNIYKIQRKYNTDNKTEINNIIDELYFNEIFIDIEIQNSIQMLINMIKTIDIMIKIYNKTDNGYKIESSVLKNKGKKISEKYLMDNNISSLEKRYELINNL